ncbi:hypothetical protein L3X38_024203 [Prunus dulcis]|uniref:Uncharacterized protein n=1 Tax=Prunus dulcis TaxID=3755 RepID=A0AAD4VZB3_PRUDU|nr:hypothetical protein L3X38_024203 [Prunus dulcis]
MGNFTLSLQEQPRNGYKVLPSCDLAMRVRALVRVGGEVRFWVEGFGWRRSSWRRGVIGGDGGRGSGGGVGVAGFWFWKKGLEEGGAVAVIGFKS